ncbi:MAG: hypothetical protein SH857_16800 [Chitinophagales bacterium]|nr:hypothetical protein [Chitinophagales bacterium]
MKFINWSSFGKFSLVAATFWTIIQIVSSLNQDEKQFEALIEINDFVIPDELKIYISPVEQLKKAEELTDSIVHIDTMSVYDRWILSQAIRNFVTEKYSINFNHYFDDLAIIDLKSESNKVVKSINVDIDGKGYFQLLDQNKKSTYGNFDQTIKIGDLRALNSMKLYLWTEYKIQPSDVRINYEDDFIIPSETIKVSGFFAWLGKYSIAENLFLRLLPFLLAIMMLIAIIIIFFPEISKLIGNKHTPE